MLQRSTLFKYIFKKFIHNFLLIIASISLIVIVATILELLRRSYGKPISINIIFKLTILKLPYLLHEIIIFIMLFTSMLTYLNLHNNHEILACRSFGYSSWQFTLPSIIASFIISLLVVCVYNPISASWLKKFENLENQYFTKGSSILSISSSGLWIKEEKGASTNILYASSVTQPNFLLHNVTLYKFINNNFISRIDAKEASIVDNIIYFKQATLNNIDHNMQKLDNYYIPTNITTKQLQKSLLSTETISFWKLLPTIKILEQSGFSTIYHWWRFCSLLIQPILFCSMVLIAAILSIQSVRKNNNIFISVIVSLFGFTFYFINKTISIIGISGHIPIFMAAIIPALIIFCIGISMVLHYEES